LYCFSNGLLVDQLASWLVGQLASWPVGQFFSCPVLQLSSFPVAQFFSCSVLQLDSSSSWHVDRFISWSQPANSAIAELIN